MKKIIFSVLSLIIVAMLFSSCEQNYDDFMTGNVKTGGLVSPLKSFPYKLGGTTTFDVPVTIFKGPGIVSLRVYKSYTGLDEVLDRTIDVSSANVDGDVNKTLTYDYADLISGLNMPADESELSIGDAWVLTYAAVMEDGREVRNSQTTTIGVANFFAGTYEVDMKYFHPTAGGSYPDDPYSAYTEEIDMVAISANECQVWFGVWEDTKITIKINADNSISLTFIDRSDAGQGDPNDATKISQYHPDTGVIEIYYFYPGSGGNRIFWAVYTPVSND
jgi:hypothetical protein